MVNILAFVNELRGTSRQSLSLFSVFRQPYSFCSEHFSEASISAGLNPAGIEALSHSLSVMLAPGGENPSIMGLVKDLLTCSAQSEICVLDVRGKECTCKALMELKCLGGVEFVGHGSFLSCFRRRIRCSGSISQRSPGWKIGSSRVDLTISGKAVVVA